MSTKNQVVIDDVYNNIMTNQIITNEVHRHLNWMVRRELLNPIIDQIGLIRKELLHTIKI